MSDAMIRVEGLGKKYRLGQRQHYYTLRETLSGLIRVGGRGSEAEESEDTFWALRDCSFEVKRGEALGVIGSNGAGKSTLLKLLSRITVPTEGRAEIHGRVGSLLEVGTGFHPELTGRENIFLNGAILGMKRREVERRFDEIVEFSEVEKFLDTPVKRYSSGMYVRLAFSVAAHFEPEVLLVDEVLAVGDAAFQRKCLGKMGDAKREGRTILFISHGLEQVKRLCDSAVVLDHGRVRDVGSAEEMVEQYLRENLALEVGAKAEFAEREGAKASFVGFRVLDSSGRESGRVGCSEDFTVEMEYRVNEETEDLFLVWMLERADNVQVLGSPQSDSGCRGSRTPGRYRARVRFPGGILNAATYRYRVALQIDGSSEDYQYGPFLEVFHDTDFGAQRAGVVLLRLDWTEEKLD